MVRKGFTLVELMIVILIVAILAAVAIPLMTGRLDSAKWSEAKAAMGTIATNIRAYCAGEGCPVTAFSGAGNVIADCQLIGLAQNDLDGTYFSKDCYGWTGAGCDSTGTISYLITATAGVNVGTRKSPKTPSVVTLTTDSAGQAVWAETP